MKELKVYLAKTAMLVTPATPLPKVISQLMSKDEAQLTQHLQTASES